MDLLEPLNPSQPITLAALQEAATRIPNDHIATGTVRSALFDVEHALVAQLNAHATLDSEPEARARLRGVYPGAREPVDIRPFLAGTVTAAYERAKTARHERPDNARRRVERLLRALAPWALAAPRRRHVSAPAALTEFHTLADCLTPLVTEPGTAGRRARAVQLGLRRFARLAASRGVVSVAGLPDDAAMMRQTLDTWGLSSSQRNDTMWVLRSTRRLLPEDARAQSIPAFDEISDGTRQEQVMSARLPGLAADLRLWSDIATRKVGARTVGNRSRTPHEPLSAASQYAYRAGFRQWCDALLVLVDRGLLRVAQPLETLDTESLWQLRVPVDASPRTQHSDTAAIAERQARKGVAPTTQRPSEQPLLLAVIEGALTHGLWGNAARGADGAWPKSSAQLAFRLWAITERLALSTYGDESHPTLVALHAIWAVIMPTLKDTLLKGPTVKDHARILRLATLPQVVCCVLPWWTLVELPRLDAEAIRLERVAARPTASAAAQRRARDAREAFREALEAYVILATFVAEPSRIKNVMHARLGREVVIDAAWSADGALVQLHGIASAFPERDKADVDVVATKTGAARPTWQWSPSIIDRAWFARYLRESWLPTVHALGLADAASSLRDLLSSGRIAFLINPHPRGMSTGAVAGAFRDDSSVAQRFGTALLLGLRAMGRTDLPSTITTASAEGFAYAFRQHVSRLWWATYWFGIRREQGPARTLSDGSRSTVTGTHVAMRATCDTAATLEQHYVVVSPVMEEQMRAPLTSMEHPNAYDHLMDRTWWHDVATDWLKVWRDPKTVLPDHLRAVVLRSGTDCTPAAPPVKRRTRRAPQGRASAR